MPAKSPLRILSDLISEAVSRIDAQYASAGLEFPSLDDPFDPTHPACVMLASPDVVHFADIIVAATEQLSITVRVPSAVTRNDSFVYVKPACIRAVLTTGVVEILREAGPKGLHVQEISKKNGVDSIKLVRIMRYLATSHIFREVTPNVFANNRVSSACDTGKASSDVLPVGYELRVDKWVGTSGVGAIAEFGGDNFMKSVAYLTDHLLDPNSAHSHEPTATPFNLAHDCPEPFYLWLSKLGNEYRRARFDVGMKGVEKESNFPILRGFPWDTLSPGSKIVDVGGGIGAHTLPLIKKFPCFKFVVQDLIVNQTEQFWEENVPGCISSGQFVVQKHDFLTPQPVKDADIFIIRTCLHNWSNKYAIQILKHLRKAAVPGKTRLLVIDTIVRYACKETHPIAKDIPGIAPSDFPDPLLPNFGRAYEWTYIMDILMLANMHGQERTIEDHVFITKEAGWKIVHIYSPDGTSCEHILAEPV